VAKEFFLKREVQGSLRHSSDVKVEYNLHFRSSIRSSSNTVTQKWNANL